MVRLDSDHVNWVLVVILVTLALLLAMVNSSASGDELGRQQANSPTVTRVDVTARSLAGLQSQKEIRSPAEVWNSARELYLAGSFGEARVEFERALAVRPSDPALRLWAGMAAYREGDRAAAIRHWRAVWCDEGPGSDAGVWPAVALAAAHLESGEVKEAARFIVPLERGDFGPDAAEHPVVSFYAAMVYEQLAIAAPKYLDAVEQSLSEKFVPALASNDRADQALGLARPGLRAGEPKRAGLVSPNSHSWLLFLAKRALQRSVRGSRALDWTEPLVSEQATTEPSLAPTVGDLLDTLGTADFASQAREKLRALQLYESPPNRRQDVPGYDDPELIKRGRFIA